MIKIIKIKNFVLQNPNILIFGLILILITIALYPFIKLYVPGFDGAYNLQIPKHLLTNHKYSTNLAPFDVMVTTGYPVLVPIYLAFIISGISILAVSIVLFSFFLAGLIAIYIISIYSIHAIQISQRTVLQYIPFVIFLALCAIKIPNASAYLFEAIGELPAFTYFLFSIIFMYVYNQRDDPKLHWLILSGILFGLAVETKLVMIMLIPALIVPSIAGKNLKVMLQNLIILTLASLIPVACFILFQLSQLGTTGFMDNVNNFLVFLSGNSGSGITLSESSWLMIFEKHLEVIKNELGIPWEGWIFLNIILVLFCLQSLRRHRYEEVGLIVAFFAYSAWWFFINYSFWLRHYIPGILLLYVLLGLLLAHLTRWLFSTSRLHRAVGGSLIILLIFSVNIFALDMFKFSFDLNRYQQTNEAYYSAIKYLKEHSNDEVYYYRGWWQVPELSFPLTSSFIDLNKISPQAISDKGYLIFTAIQKNLDPKFYWQNKKMCEKPVFENSSYFICKIKI